MKLLHCTLLTVSLFIAACGEKPQLPALAQDAIILAFGDSLTHGTGAKPDESYPAILQTLSGRKVINAGIPGEESEQGLQRLPEMLEKHRPALLILCHGGNDILRKRDMKKMESNLRQMISMSQDRNIPVIMMAVPQFGIFLSPAPLYEEIAGSAGVVFIMDLIPDVLKDNTLKSDAVHPNRDGYRKIAETIHALLQEAGAI
jgi:lysophospholipase L1-like esterase